MEKKQLAFYFDISEAEFNYAGRFYLQLSIQSSFTKDYSQVQVLDYDGTPCRSGHETNTDIIDVTKEDPHSAYTFTKNRFAFYLPKGFCKNDNRHDVFLLVEAFDFPRENNSRKVGEAKFAIYPRTNAPRVNISAPPGQDMYKTSNVMTLLRTLSTENLHMHCGRLKYTARLRQYSTLPTTSPVATPRDATPTPRTPKAVAVAPSQKSTPRESNSIETYSPRTPTMKSTIVDSPPEKTHRTPPPVIPVADWNNQRHLDRIQISKSRETPLAQNEDNRWRNKMVTSLVSSPGSEEVVVLLHGATDIPPKADGSTPKPFITVKTKTDEDRSIKAQGVTHATTEPTHDPTWEEVVTVQYEPTTSRDELLIIDVVDRTSKQVLVSYLLPPHFLQPFHHYHIEMIMPSSSSGGTRLFATLMRKTSYIPRDLASPKYVGLEVLLRAVEHELNNPIGPLIAVSRVVSDYVQDRGCDLDKFPGFSYGLKLLSVTFPSTHSSSFDVLPEPSQGHPQLSLPGYPSEQPEWDHTFFFSQSRDNATFFTPGAALIIEFYQANSVLSDMSLGVHESVGFCAIPLDQLAYTQLTTKRGLLGIRVEGLPIQGTNLRTIHDKRPTIGLILRLLMTDRPAILGQGTDFQNLPMLDRGSVSGSNQQPGSSLTPRENLELNHQSDDWMGDDYSSKPFGSDLKPRISRRLLFPIQDGQLPAPEAIEQILPEYQHIFGDRPKPNPTGGLRRSVPDYLEPNSLSLLDHQSKDLDRYRTAVQKMGQDILELRQQIQKLEAQNSELRLQLAKYSDTTKLLLDSQNMDGLSRPELSARYVAMKQKLTRQTGELRDYKERVQQLHNDLIKKNESEKQLIRMSHAHESQNDLLQNLQEKAQRMKTLEEAYKKQEKVIQKLERSINKSGRDSTGVNEALRVENERLREQRDDVTRKDMFNSRMNPTSDMEKFKLLQKLERAEGRILSLEHQLSENARKWGRDRSDLITKLQEADHGFRRTSPLGYSNYPSFNSNRSYEPALKEELRRVKKVPTKHSRYTLSPRLHPL